MQVAESVGIGHPDKIADAIADNLLDYVLKRDFNAQFACEVLVSKNLISIAGELFWSLENLCVNEVVEKVLCNLGYDAKNFEIVSNIRPQSTDIRFSSIEGINGIVSGDQSIVFGFASNETSNYMPLAFVVATDLVRYIESAILLKKINGIKFDSKSLVVLEGKLVKHLSLSVHHEANVDVKKEIYENVVLNVISKYGLDVDERNIFINSAGPFVIGGLDADTGITNRKLIVDSYGPSTMHGGGGYSGKDLTKVDRLGAYYARWICKNFVASKVCDLLEIRLVFNFGSKFPISFDIVKFESEFKYKEVLDSIKSIFSFNFSEIYSKFNETKLEYSKLSCYGHFGRTDLDLPWERLDKVEEIKSYFYGH